MTRRGGEGGTHGAGAQGSVGKAGGGKGDWQAITQLIHSCADERLRRRGGGWCFAGPGSRKWVSGWFIAG